MLIVTGGLISYSLENGLLWDVKCDRQRDVTFFRIWIILECFNCKAVRYNPQYRLEICGMLIVTGGGM